MNIETIIHNITRKLDGARNLSDKQFLEKDNSDYAKYQLLNKLHRAKADLDNLIFQIRNTLY